MSITLKVKGSSAPVTLEFNTISEDVTSSKMKIGVGTGEPVYIQFGYEKTITATGKIYTAADHTIMKTWNGDILLDCTASTYPEISVSVSPSSNYIVVDKNKLSRKGGYLNMWDFSLTLIQGNIGTSGNLKRWT